MSSTAKILVPNKEWLVQDHEEKIGSISKNKKGYLFLCKGKSMPFKDLAEMKSKLGIVLFEESLKKIKVTHPEPLLHAIYDFPCHVKPHEPIYSIKEKLPLYVVRDNSKSQFCAGYYLVKIREEWSKVFCPKLITLQRYPYYGPYKMEDDMNQILINLGNS